MSQIKWLVSVHTASLVQFGLIYYYYYCYYLFLFYFIYYFFYFTYSFSITAATRSTQPDVRDNVSFFAPCDAQNTTAHLETKVDPTIL